jgi:hypothetical protein
MLTIPANMIDREGIEAGDNIATAEAINVLLSALNSLLARQRSILPVGIRTAELVGTGITVGEMEGNDFGTNTDAGIGIEINGDITLPGGLGDKWRIISGRDAVGPYLGIFNSSNDQGTLKIHVDAGIVTLYPDTSGNSVNADFRLGASSTQRWDEGWFRSINVSEGITDAGGTLIGQWQNYIPVFEGSGSNPVGFDTPAGRYMQIDRTVWWWAQVTANSGWTDGTGFYRISLPLQAANVAGVAGHAVAIDASTGDVHLGQFVGTSDTRAAAYWIDGGGTGAKATIHQSGTPFAMADDDVLRWYGTYEIT